MISILLPKLTYLVKQSSKFKGNPPGSATDVQGAATVTCLCTCHVTQVSTNQLATLGRQLSNSAAGGGAELRVQRCGQSIRSVSEILAVGGCRHHARVLTGVHWEIMLCTAEDRLID